MLEDIKTLSNCTDETLINLLIDKTKVELLDIAKLTEYDDSLDNVLVDMVVVKLNRKGNEGLASFSASGMSENYIDDYPDHVRRQLRKYTHKVTVR